MKTVFAVIGAAHMVATILIVILGLFTDHRTTCSPPPLFEIARAYRNGWTGGVINDPLSSHSTSDLIAAKEAICQIIYSRPTKQSKEPTT